MSDKQQPDNPALDGVVEDFVEDVTAKVKTWWKSKTIIFNGIALSLIALEANTGLLEPYLPKSIYVWIAVGLPIVNVWLRFYTNSGLCK